MTWEKARNDLGRPTEGGRKCVPVSGNKMIMGDLTVCSILLYPRGGHIHITEFGEGQLVKLHDCPLTSFGIIMTLSHHPRTPRGSERQLPTGVTQTHAVGPAMLGT